MLVSYDIRFWHCIERFAEQFSVVGAVEGVMIVKAQALMHHGWNWDLKKREYDNVWPEEINR